MKAKGEKIAAGYLTGKVLTNINVKRKGLKIALQQAYQNIRVVKVENLGGNLFMFYFGTEVDKR